MEAEEVVIIGAGPAGLATAIQLNRYGLSPLVFEKDQAGGLLRNANLVENYPGFPQGLPGMALAQLFAAQARQHSVRIIHEAVLILDWNDPLFEARTADRVVAARVAVIASGTRPKTLPEIEIPADLAGRVFYEVHPLLHLEGKRLAIIGAGDTAFDYALNLGRKNTVVILNRGREVHCLPLLWERASAAPHIAYRPEAQVVAIRSHAHGGLALECRDPGGVATLQADYLVCALGRDACLDFVSGHLRERWQALESSGWLYAVGDVRNGLYRQSSIAVGEGVRAAMSIYQRLREPRE